MSTTNNWPQVPPPTPIENSSDNSSDVRINPGGQKNMTIFSSSVVLAPPDNTGTLQIDARFQPGVSGNPKGRPKGSRNRMSELLMRTLVDDFAAHGREALAKVRTRDPEVYFKLIVALLPKSLILKYEETQDVDYESITEDEFLELINSLQRRKLMKQTVESLTK